VTNASESTISVGQVLFGDTEFHNALRNAVRVEAAMKRIGHALELVTPMLRDAAFDELTNVIASALDLNLTDVLVLGWRKYEALAEAARRSLENPGEEQIVTLAEHRIRSIHQPSVEIVVDSAKVAEIHLKIELAIELEAVCGVVSIGRLIALRSGRATIKAALWCEGVRVKWSTQELDLHLQAGLGSGLVLAEPPVLVRLPDAPEPRQVTSILLEPRVS